MSSKFEILTLKRMTSLDVLLRELLSRCGDSSHLLKVGLIRAIILAKKNQNRTKTRTHLNDVSMHIEKMENNENEFKEVMKKDVDKKLGAISKNTKPFFKEAFDFITMENEFTIKMVLE
jgi:hypothetical protein